MVSLQLIHKSEIKYDICELISNKTDYNGNYEKFIMDNNPYNLISYQQRLPYKE